MDKKVQECIKYTKEVLRLLECPVCYNRIDDNFIQCIAGHHICQPCMANMNNTCPVCKKHYIGTKLFIAKDIYTFTNDLQKTLSSFNLKNSDTDSVEKYRTIIKSLLNTVSLLLGQVRTTLDSVSICLVRKDESKLSYLESQMNSLTTELNYTEKEMKGAEKILTSLKNTNTN